MITENWITQTIEKGDYPRNQDLEWEIKGIVKKTRYVLFSCNEWKEFRSISLLGMTDNLDLLTWVCGNF